jgi:hypothetical protein
MQKHMFIGGVLEICLQKEDNIKNFMDNNKL